MSEKECCNCKEVELYKSCECGEIVEMVCTCGEPVSCCGQRMERMTPNMTEGAAPQGQKPVGAQEKHLPVVEREGDIITVKVGEIFHPMEEKHSIQWVTLQTRQGTQRKHLPPTGEPVVRFALIDGDEPQSVYAYCNLHGLWKTEL